MLHSLLVKQMRLSALLFAFWLTSIACASAQVVDIKQGKIKGVEQFSLLHFLGVPYAQPPVGRLRWQAPLAVKAHKGTLLAESLGAKCIQPKKAKDKSQYSEDCLTLNVWTPATDSKKRPVMVWIHGGGFRSGSSDIPGGVFAAKGAVVVSMNYRIGPLGFFAHDSLPERPANFGLLDIIQSLKWVEQNIHAFGGDPENVTIFGVSAGAMAVELLMVSEPASGLFDKAIAQSGYATWPLPRSVADTPKDNHKEARTNTSAQTLAREWVSRVSTQKQSTEMLYQLDASKLVNALDGFLLPIVDGQSLVEEPAILFSQGKQNTVPYISGGNSFEGSVMGVSGVSENDYRNMLGSEVNTTRILYQSSDDKVWIKRAWGDNRYLLSARTTAAYMKNVNKPAWLYYIDFVPQMYKAQAVGTYHGSDAQILWGGTFSKVEEIKRVAHRLQQYWFNFALNGNPNSEGLIPWPKYRANSKQWLYVTDENQVKINVIGDKLDLMERLYLERVELIEL